MAERYCSDKFGVRVVRDVMGCRDQKFKHSSLIIKGCDKIIGLRNILGHGECTKK